jgi:hypothetical protein
MGDDHQHAVMRRKLSSKLPYNASVATRLIPWRFDYRNRSEQVNG